jgi:hypothetical protein
MTKIRLLTRIAFGFRSPNALIALAMLSLAGHRPVLPGRPNPRISGYGRIPSLRDRLLDGSSPHRTLFADLDTPHVTLRTSRKSR